MAGSSSRTLKDLEPNLERGNYKKSSDTTKEDYVEVVAKRMSRLSLVCVDEMPTSGESNPLLLNGNCVDDYLTDDVLCSDVWKCLSITRRDKFISYLNQALKATVKKDALYKLKKAFSTAGKHSSRLMDAIPWLSEELNSE